LPAVSPGDDCDDGADFSGQAATTISRVVGPAQMSDMLQLVVRIGN
jgi:hypothetical protein